MASQSVSKRTYRIFKTPTRPQIHLSGDLFIRPTAKPENAFGFPLDDKEYLENIAAEKNLSNEEPFIIYEVLEQVTPPGHHPYHNDNNAYVTISG